MSTASGPRPSCGIFNSEPYFIIMLCSNFINIPLISFAIYTIIYKSSRAMRTYSWFLLLHVITLAVVNIQYTLLVIPYFIFPVWGGMALGLYTKLNVSGVVQFVVLLISMSFTVTSAIWLFYYRAQVVLPEGHRLKHSANGMILFMGGLLVGNTVAPLHLAFLFVGEQNEEQMKQEYDQKLPCQMDILFDSRIHVMNPRAGLYLSSFFSLFFIFSISIVAIFASALLRHLLSRRSTLSKSTRNLQLSFIKALSIQIGINVLMVITPTAILMAARGIAAHRQILNNICVVVQTFNITGDLLAMFLLNRPYRDHLFRREKVSKTSTIRRAETNGSLDIAPNA